MTGSGRRGFDHGGASITAAWDEEAEAWIRWARSPGHDDYYERYNLPNFLDLLPDPGRRTLDLGAGEGRLGRVLRARGHHVVGVEPSMTLGRAARDAEPAIPMAQGDASAVPIATASVDLVVCFMVLQDRSSMSVATSK